MPKIKRVIISVYDKKGIIEFAIIAYDEFIKIQEQIDDYDCLKALREARTKESDAKTVSLEEAKRTLDIE